MIRWMLINGGISGVADTLRADWSSSVEKIGHFGQTNVAPCAGNDTIIILIRVVRELANVNIETKKGWVDAMSARTRQESVIFSQSQISPRGLFPNSCERLSY